VFSVRKAGLSDGTARGPSGSKTPAILLTAP
jgi:hypothetical protein